MGAGENRDNRICNLHAGLEDSIKSQLTETNTKVDSIRTMLHEYRLDLAKGYVTKKEFNHMVNKMENFIGEKKDKNVTNGFLPPPPNHDFKEKVIFQLVDFGKLLIYAAIILAGAKGTGLL